MVNDQSSSYLFDTLDACLYETLSDLGFQDAKPHFLGDVTQSHGFKY